MPAPHPRSARCVGAAVYASGAVLMSDRKRAAVIGHDVSMYCKVRRGLYACMRGGCKRCLLRHTKPQ
ncbi:hypothetical protein D1605_002785 [Xylella fastidiosa subsp. fastidiosa]|uniref:hypothetical protein n=1 Tax=Xylella fastidiosa TaxID=2371 RepID=UPI001375B186|nr:hypothetical protein [Xylella fastidiosa]MBE0264206.1 hypothetical protein [Xylella fastidiosa subsp. fastidiosa]MBE0265893.1 hypothetical protein [Xylella fastidiosa subsp. fastidiosa]MBE0270313.1 hypothetical protein [Xylella fastidiosa subsp. fastidiosa]MBE0288199.1 hypothetical protein [Xylella fastidiosa subsp. fastidiosa]MBE0290394.1 hypothetical protein [Xylella fastidiosa subsp. fastidiosa]